MAPFIVSSFGLFVMGLFQGLFTAPSWQTFLLLSVGWALATERHTITTYLWLTGATSVKHFSRFYVFLGGALYSARWQLWARIIRVAAQWVPAEEPIVIEVDDSTKKKAGLQIEGRRPLPQRRGLGPPGISHAARAQLCVGDHAGAAPVLARPLCQCPDRLVALPQRGTSAAAQVPYQSRSALAREIVDFVAAQLPARPIRVLGDGGYATKDYLQKLPATVHVVGRMLITGQALCAAAQPRGPRRGCPPKKGPLLGSPKTLARKRQRLAAASHRSRGAGPSVDGAVAYRLAGPRAPRGGGPPPHAAAAPPAQAAQTPAARGSVFHHRSHAESGGDPRPVSRPLGRGNHDSR